MTERIKTTFGQLKVGDRFWMGKDNRPNTASTKISATSRRVYSIDRLMKPEDEVWIDAKAEDK